MTIYALIFYVLAAIILVTTGLAITRRNLVHVVMYLVFSFFGSAMMFYLFGAPLLAVLEVIIYAGAIMILFLRWRSRWPNQKHSENICFKDTGSSSKSSRCCC
jgi:NADH:ubiquinone oxidoreductase subunit 6 (subunit J)